LPSVELTSILFTDLVGSTGLESRVGPAKAHELRREHFSVLRDAIEAGEGREVKNTGDGLMVSFTSSSSAVECGVRMQAAHGTPQPPSTKQLHLRIGIGPARRRRGRRLLRDAVDRGGRLLRPSASDGIFASQWRRWMAGLLEDVV